MVDQFRYFGDYQLSQQGVAAARTVTEADVVNFACMTADYNRVHLDRQTAANNIYGGRVAHGLLGSSLVTGMLSLSAPHILGRGVTGACFYGFDANYRRAIKLGDTISVRWRVAEKADDLTHAGFGLVKTAFEVVNQEGDSVYDGTVSTLVRKESAREAELQLRPEVPWQVIEYVPDPQKVYYVEDCPVGEGGESDGRTITETDIVNFAGLTGDYNPQHVDAEFARRSVFGDRIAHGMLVFTFAYGLWVRKWSRYQWPRTNVAAHLNDRAVFLAPVKIGDTIRCRYKILDSKPSRSKPEVGLVTFGLQVINQREELVQEGSTINMVSTRMGRRT